MSLILLFGIAPKSKQKGLGLPQWRDKLYSKTCKLRVIARKHSKLVLRTQTPNAFFRFTILQNTPFQAFFSLHKLCLFLFTTVFSVRAFLPYFGLFRFQLSKSSGGNFLSQDGFPSHSAKRTFKKVPCRHFNKRRLSFGWSVAQSVLFDLK